ncbi:MAG: DUF3598 family protein [Cyanobacteria bacterium P01_F01_bin.4]
MHPHRRCQWDNIRKNLGEWYGSFAQYSPDGTWVKATPSLLTLVEDQPDQQMTLVLERTPPNGITDTTVRKFSYPGPAPYAYFFETGAFSQGALYYQPGQFGAELALIQANQRRRCVQMYAGSADRTSHLAYVTLIQEQRGEPVVDCLPPLTLADLQGGWKGQAKVVSAQTASEKLSKPVPSEPSAWHLNLCAPPIKDSIGDPIEPLVEYQATIGEIYQQTIVATPQGQRLVAQKSVPWQMLLLPGSTYCILPQQIYPGRPFTLEVGWLIAPRRCQRLLRCYNAQGEWTHLIFATDEKQDG